MKHTMEQFQQKLISNTLNELFQISNQKYSLILYFMKSWYKCTLCIETTLLLLLPEHGGKSPRLSKVGQVLGFPMDYTSKRYKPNLTFHRIYQKRHLYPK